MTKEEIIHRLQYARHRIDNITFAPDVLKAIDIAIETVSNTDTDTISRQAAIDALRKMQTYKLFSGDDMLLIDQAGAQTELMMLPPAQPERIKGYWIAMEKKNLFRCSECDAVIYSESERDRNKFHKFCGRCGAEMEVTE